MYVKTVVKSALIASTMLCGWTLGTPIGSAEAGEYYTRKRVNGVWITGLFPKKQSFRTKAAATAPTAQTPVAAGARAAPPASPVKVTAATAATMTAPAAASTAAIGSPALAASAVPALVAPTTTGALPPANPTDLARGEERTAPLQRAHEAKSSIDVESLGPQEARLLPLQRALEARAKSMGGGASLPRTVKVVTFNFETGLRTSVYDDGSVVEEFFDPVTAPLTFARR